MSAQPWVESKVRDRVARVVVLSLVIGYSAAAALHLASPAPTAVATAIKPAVVSIAPVAAVAIQPKPKTQPPPPKAKVDLESELEALPINPNGHLIVSAKDFLLTDHRRVRVGEAPFRPVKKALISFQKTSKMPAVTLTAAADIPEVHVSVVKKFMERFYGWKITTVTSDKPGTFELDVAPAEGVNP